MIFILYCELVGLQTAMFRILSAVLYLGNIEFVEHLSDSVSTAERVCLTPRRF